MPAVGVLKTSYDPHAKVANVSVVDSIEWGDKDCLKNLKYIYVGINPGVVNLGITVLYCKCPITNISLIDLLDNCIVYITSYTAAGCPWTASKAEKTLSLKKIINALLPAGATRIAVEEQLIKTNNGFVEGIIYGCIGDTKKVVRGRITALPVTRLLSTTDAKFTYNKNNNKKRKHDCFICILKILGKVSNKIHLNHRTGHYDTTDSLILAICGTII